MVCDKVYEFEVNGFKAKLECYLGGGYGKRYGLLIIPGGGYFGVCEEHEGRPVAEAFLPHKFNCFVLTYSVIEDGATYPTALIQASKAMEYIKDNADELNVFDNKIFVLGFSAGGHLASNLGTEWYKVDEVEYGKNKPAGMVLCYPVITGEKGKCHFGSFQSLLGTENPTDDQIRDHSIENLVTDKTCPTFLWHTVEDDCVPVYSSLKMATALTDNHITYEMHIYPHGPHGQSLYNNITCSETIDLHNAEWVQNAVYWMLHLNVD